MEIVPILFFLILFGILFITMGMHFVDVIRIGIMAISPNPVRRFIHRHLLVWPLKEQYKKCLGPVSPFYRALDPTEKKSFEKRVQRFIDAHQFISREKGSSEVSDERIIHISAVATELTYGLPHIYFEYFDRIIVYEDDYYSKITRKWHQGEVNVRGFIVLSWKNFMRGVGDSDDGVHLGFHEMAHALQLEDHLETSNYEFFNKKKLGRLKLLASEIESNGDSEFFRKSAFSNRFEFFAVAIESVFERPLELKEQQPELFGILTDLLRHDPSEYLLRGSSAVRFD